MIFNDEATKIDSRQSYSIDESVAKMLGWMKGANRLQKVGEDKYGPILNQMPHLYSLLYPIENYLQLHLDRAKHEYNEALRDNEIIKLYAEQKSSLDTASVLNESEETLSEKYEQISYLNKLTENAQSYKLMIEHELDKESELSELKVDQLTTNEKGNVHITLKSLNYWAKQFGLYIIDIPERLVDSTQIPQEKIAQVVNIEVKNVSTEGPIVVRRIRQRHNELSKLIDSILEVMPNPTAGKVMAELRKLIADPNSCIICTAEDGVQWENIKGQIKTLKHKALAGRIADWLELPLA